MKKVTQIEKGHLFLLLWFFSFGFYALLLYVIFLIIGTLQTISIYGLMAYVFLLVTCLPFLALWSWSVTSMMIWFKPRVANILTILTSLLTAFFYYCFSALGSIVSQKPLLNSLTELFWVTPILPAFLITVLLVRKPLRTSNLQRIQEKAGQSLRDAVCLSGWVSSLHVFLLVVLAVFGVIRQHDDISTAITIILACCVILFPTNFFWALTSSLFSRRFYFQVGTVSAVIFHLLLSVPLSGMYDGSFALDSGFSMNAILFSYSFVLVAGLLLARWWNGRESNVTFEPRLRKKNRHVVNLSPDWNSVDN